MPEPQSQEKTATPRLSTSTAECFHVVLASVLLLTFATASVLAVKFSYMSCVPDFRGSPEAGTCPSLLNGNAIQNTTTEELYKSKGCSVVAGCTAFEHPILQIAVIDFFLIFCVPAHHLLNACQQRDGAYSEIKDDHQRAPQPHGWLPSGAQVRRLFAIGFCSYSTLCLCGLGLQYMYASAFNMVRLTSTVIFTSVLNATFLKRRLHAHQAYGLLLVIAGLLIVGASSLNADFDDRGARNPGVGIGLVISGSFLLALEAVLIESFFETSDSDATNDRKMTSMEMCGWVGVIVFGFSTMTLVCMYFIPMGEDTCADGRPCLDNTITALRQLATSPAITSAFLLRGLSGMSTQLCNNFIIKGIGSRAKNVIMALSSLPIWLISISMGWESFDIVQCIGFVMLVWGNLIYLSILDSSFLHLPRALAKPASSLGPVIESSDNERDGLMTAKASDCAEGDPGDATDDTESYYSPSESITLEEQIDRLGFGRFQTIALVAFVTFQIGAGMEIATANLIWNSLPEDWGLSSSGRALFAGISFLGFAVGTGIAAVLGDFYGRRPLLIGHSSLFIPSSILSGLSQGFGQLVLMRFVVGISCGLALPTVVAMMSELAPSRNRARSIISIPGFAYCFGACAVIVVGIILLHHKVQGWHWRLMLMCGAVPNILGLSLVVYVLPESPRYLLVCGRMKDLREAVVLIASMNGTSEKLVNGGWCQQLPEVDRLHEKSTSRHLADLISEWKNLRIQLLVLPAWSLLAFVLFGQAYLLPIFFESLSMSTEKEYWMLLLFQGLDVAGLLVLISTIDRPGIGRQKSIAGSAILCAISALLASFFWLQQGFCVLFVFMVLMKISAIMAFEGMYVYAAELVPTSHRQSALSLGVGLSKAASGFIGMLLSPLMNVQTAQSLTPETVDQSAPYLVLSLAAIFAAVLTSMGPEVSPNQQLTDVFETSITDDSFTRRASGSISRDDK